MGETRETYVQKLKAQIDRWNARMDKLEGEGKRLRADAKAEYDERLNRLRSMRDDLKDRVAEVQKAGETRWEALKAAVESAKQEFQTALEETEEKPTGSEEPPATPDA